MADGSTIIVPYHPSHLFRLDLQDCQKRWDALIGRRDYAEQLLRQGPAYTAICDGRVLGCAGFEEMWEGRAVAWALFSSKVGGGMIKICRAIKAELAKGRYNRVEAAVYPALDEQGDIPDGGVKPHLLANLMGFHVETVRAKNYTSEGDTATLYVWLKGAN